MLDFTTESFVFSCKFFTAMWNVMLAWLNKLEIIFLVISFGWYVYLFDKRNATLNLKYRYCKKFNLPNNKSNILPIIKPLHSVRLNVKIASGRLRLSFSNCGIYEGDLGIVTYIAACTVEKCEWCLKVGLPRKQISKFLAGLFQTV